jgi:hypothetical protein
VKPRERPRKKLAQKKKKPKRRVRQASVARGDQQEHLASDHTARDASEASAKPAREKNVHAQRCRWRTHAFSTPRSQRIYKPRTIFKQFCNSRRESLGRPFNPRQPTGALFGQGEPGGREHAAHGM